MDESPIWVSGNNFEACPTGMQPAVCSAVHNLGTQPGWQGQGTRHMIALVFELAERQKEGDFAGKRFIRSVAWTATLGERANLRKNLESWRGKSFTPDEIKRFDVRTVNGKNCTLNLVEKQSSSGRTCVVIDAILPPIRGKKNSHQSNRGLCRIGWLKSIFRTQIPIPLLSLRLTTSTTTSLSKGRTYERTDAIW